METEQYKMIVHNLKIAIDESGMKQKVIAERAGMTPRKLNDILCLRQRLSTESIPTLCGVLNIQPAALFDGVIVS